MSRLMTSLFALGLGLSCMGCVTRQITRFEDNQKSPVTALELVKKTNYVLFPGPVVYQFYLCQDTGDKLVCSISCDGKNDAVCPMGLTAGSFTTTNVR
jgi:hypothetical protein